jgi:hypothetical protein
LAAPRSRPLSKRLAALREDLLCAYLVLRELHDYGQHYGEAARGEIVQKALAALRNAWADTGAKEDDIEPALLALLATGKIGRARPATPPTDRPKPPS